MVSLVDGAKDYFETLDSVFYDYLKKLLIQNIDKKKIDK